MLVKVLMKISGSILTVSIKDLDMREKIRDNLVPFLTQELGIPPSTLLAKWQHLPWREVD